MPASAAARLDMIQFHRRRRLVSWLAREVLRSQAPQCSSVLDFRLLSKLYESLLPDLDAAFMKGR